jgi:hypothetical protein
MRYNVFYAVYFILNEKTSLGMPESELIYDFVRVRLGDKPLETHEQYSFFH